MLVVMCDHMNRLLFHSFHLKVALLFRQSCLAAFWLSVDIAVRRATNTPTLYRTSACQFDLFYNPPTAWSLKSTLDTGFSGPFFIVCRGDGSDSGDSASFVAGF